MSGKAGEAAAGEGPLPIDAVTGPAKDWTAELRPELGGFLLGLAPRLRPAIP